MSLALALALAAPGAVVLHSPLAAGLEGGTAARRQGRQARRAAIPRELSGTAASERSDKARGWYGLESGAAPFTGMEPDKIAETLSEWGVSLVFGGYSNPKLAEALARRGIRRFAVLGCFQGERHWTSHPESRPIDSDGKPIRKVGWYAGVCPSQDWLRRELLAAARAFAVDPAVDGVWLDFIRYPTHWEVPRPGLPQTCFCPVCLRGFERHSGLSIPSSLRSVPEKARWILGRHSQSWTEFKTDSIAGFVDELRRAARKARAGFLVGVFLIPWGPEENSGALTRIAGQDPAKLGARADVVSPMVYHSLIGRPVEWISEAVEKAARASSAPVWPIVLASEWPRKISHEELREAVRLADREPSSGVLVFPQKVLGSAVHRDGLSSLFP